MQNYKNILLALIIATPLLGMEKLPLAHAQNQKGSLEKGRELFAAAQAGDQLIVKELLENPKIDFNWQNPNQRQRSVLAVASVFGHTDIVESLLKKGANPNVEDGNGRTPLWEAAYNGETQVVEKLVGAGAQIDKVIQHRTIIEWTRRRGFIPLAAYLEAEKRKQN